MWWSCKQSGCNRQPRHPALFYGNEQEEQRATEAGLRRRAETVPSGGTGRGVGKRAMEEQ